MRLALPDQSFLLAADEPAGGAALDQVAIATVGALAVTAVLLWLCAGHRSGRVSLLGRAAALSQRVSGLPGWAALPSAIAAVALFTALLGMYWDISLHIGVGRDAGPLANPAHYLILAGLFGIFAAGVVAIVLPRDELPGRASIRIAEGWHAPVGGVLIAVCGAFALLGFPLDDVWHRLFGQDVTLWGPTHLMLIGGAGMTLIGQAVLLAEGVQATGGARRETSLVTATRRVALMGGLLIGLSTFQAEFDFGVPQFQLIFQPILISLAAGVALVTARIWVGRGGAIGAALFFLGVRGAVALIVGPVLGETTPVLPLYLGAAVSVELAALALRGRSPLALGAVGGLLAGTLGFATEWGWSHVVMPLPWTDAILPEALVLSAITGVAGGLIGALMGSALLGELPRPSLARPVAIASVLAVMAVVANGLVTSAPSGVTASVTTSELRPSPGREIAATVRFDPPQAAADAAWVTVTAWQGGGLVVDRLERVGTGVYRTTEPIPVDGEWKALVRLHRGRELLGMPLFLPRDRAIPVPEVPLLARFERPFTSDHSILQREQKAGVPTWLTLVAPLVVLAIALGLVAALGWGLGRVGAGPGAPREPPRREPQLGSRALGAGT